MSDRPSTEERRLRALATATWVALILSVTLARSLPTLSPRIIDVVEGLSVAGCLLLLLPRKHHNSGQGERQLMVWMLVIPITALVLAVARGNYGDTVSPGVSALALLAFGRLDWRSRGISAWQALAGLIGLSILAGLVNPSLVEPNQRSFLRMLYDGRLVGVLQTPNVLGESAVLLIILSIAVQKGRARTAGIGLAGFSIVAASSQTAAGAAAAAVLIWLIWRRFGNAGLTWTCWTAATAGLGWLLWVAVSRPFFSVGDLIAGLKFSDRTNVWSVLLSYHVPFTGLGQTRLSQVFAENIIVGASGVSSAQDVGLDAYMRDGWVGLIALLVALYGVVRFIAARRSLLGLTALAAFLIESSLEVTPSHVPYYTLFFTAITTSTLAGRGSEVTAHAHPQRVLVTASPAFASRAAVNLDRPPTYAHGSS